MRPTPRFWHIGLASAFLAGLGIVVQQPVAVLGSLGEQPDERGASFIPTGATLFRAFERSLTGSLGSEPSTVVEQVADALVETFEFATMAESSVAVDEERATLVLSDTVCADASLPDNPLESLMAVALSEARSEPVRLETTHTEEGLNVTYRWDPAESDESADVVDDDPSG